jgi:hypothetical protein
MPDDPPELFDSGYTPEELDALLTPFMKKKPSWPDENLLTAMTIGLSDGDVVAMSDRGTVLLETPRAELDRRLAAIREKIAAGLTPAEALEAVLA